MSARAAYHILITLKEAAATVLTERASALTAREIHDEILRRALFSFRGNSGTLGPVPAMLKRHVLGAHSCTPAKTKTFRLVDGDHYRLQR